MKYLKTYEAIVSYNANGMRDSEKHKEALKWSVTIDISDELKEIRENLKDICLELQDQGYDIGSHAYENNHDNSIMFRIYIATPGLSDNDVEKTDIGDNEEFIETIKRTINYMKDLGYIPQFEISLRNSFTGKELQQDLGKINKLRGSWIVINFTTKGVPYNGVVPAKK